MKHITTILLSFCMLGMMLIGTSTAEAQKAVSQYKNGWPSRSGDIDIRTGFVNPPSGYGNVPFYWWSGDPLNFDRLCEQLDILSDAPTSGLNVSYNHTHPRIDTLENKDGWGSAGRLQGGVPRVMSEDWWKIWNQFSGRCADKGIGLGMDDYVLAWKGNHEFIDTVMGLPEIRNYQGKIDMDRIAKNDKRPENVISEVKIPGTDSLWVVYTHPSPELSPLLGKKVVEYYFQPFVDHMDEHGRQGMNYFFQDELNVSPDIHAWSEDMAEQFKKRKGYDILPYLPSLWEDMGPETTRYRLDYAEVVSQLFQERFLKPIYDWIAEKGLIYGSDNEGRGLNPLQYMDYFQAEQWFTAPGNDAPARGSSFNQTKVSSSITHLYQRPRTWLEAFHSMGWDANGALLTHQLDHHIIAGGNLLCMHGLYYGTHGGWWEWAPPSFHFRMPYWPHMKVWLKYAERLCFLMSQGVHVADVAILYPTETMQAVYGTNAESSIAVGAFLSEHGCDYDYINYTNLQQAKVKDGTLKISDENYKVLVLVDTQAMHEETWRKIQEFRENGGQVIIVGKAMESLQKLQGATFAKDKEEVLQTIRHSVDADFITQRGEGRVLHRRIGNQDVYMVMDVEPGDKIYFRAKGRLEQWDAQHGTMTEIPAKSVTDKGTWLTNVAEKDVSRLYVFSPSDGKPLLESDVAKQEKTLTSHAIEGEWTMEIVPTMNNKWGDFRFPATDEMIGVEARDMESVFIAKNMLRNNSLTDLKALPLDTLCHYGYGPHMEVSVNGGEWQNYNFSWQYGVFDNPGSQGYHGLKAKVDPRFLILDKEGQMDFRTHVFVPQDGRYRIVTEGTRPDALLIDGKAAGEVLEMQAGWHDLNLSYLNTKEGHCQLGDLRYGTDDRARSMVIVYPENAPEPQKYGPYDSIVASKWYGTEHLVYDPHGGEDGMWLYHFQTANGAQRLKLKVNGTIQQMWVDGKKTKIGKDGLVNIKNKNPYVGDVYVLAKPEKGFCGSAFFAEPVRISCKDGKTLPGDWTKLGAMKFYSGGVRYSKDLEINLKAHEQVLLDVGEVDATCEVAVNGQKVDVLLNKPYQVDITPYLRDGKNKIEILVYSSLSNHYQSIPSPYKGTPHAGLIGPVNLLW